ncbi:hypothetical protein [Ectobacillus ponti]|uniref:Uncharacterized protein n=1 Tax=Ectobacillus ponti TaxID=2961894 RepID=A0AA42BPI4_9BACI|nr:hypothetical protein [Ectobacillus ponti]MCP8969160.1 hypothetical protein [Ectobacillus ponti]
MEELLKQMLEQMEQMREEVRSVSQRLDSIEHRVSVNQIDLTDIKELAEMMETVQKEELLRLSRILKEGGANAYVKEELKHLHQRLDAQLLKIARNEEAILMMGGKEIQ